MIKLIIYILSENVLDSYRINVIFGEIRKIL